MSFKALEKKTLGMENENYLFLSFIYTFILVIALLFLSCVEFAGLVTMRSAKIKKESTTLMITVLHSAGFAILLIPLAVVYLKWFLADLRVTKHSPLIPMAHFFFVVLYMYNPWIIEYRGKINRRDYHCMLKNVEKKSSYVLLDFMWKSIISLSLYAITTFPSTWVLWRMSKVKPDYDGDEPYLVIYGGEGSITKKTDTNSE
ncbi:unnamed protein product [Caenorhabditis brenneri]